MDKRTLSYINLYAILGSIPTLCQVDKEAKEIIAHQNISVGFEVKNGPAGTLRFKDGKCSFSQGAEDCMIKLPFSSPEKFNGMIEGTVTPIPSKGFTKIGFLLHDFMKLTDILQKYLRPAPGALEEEQFLDASTRVMFSLIVAAVCAVGNEDKIGRSSASYMTDGVVKLEIGGGPVAYIQVKNHTLSIVKNELDSYSSYMRFENMHTARELFDGRVNAVVCVGLGKVRVGGMISQVDNLNRIMDRVSAYLA